jgi:pyruvate formate lyase activating enzyme
MNSLPIKWFQGTSLIDYPGRVASIVFVGGCNFRCRFCYNRDLVSADAIPDIDAEEIFRELKHRRGFIDGVVITGGEPTLNHGIIDFLCAVKRLGVDAKIDTNGSNPETLEWIIEERLAEYVAMDYKAPLRKLDSVTGAKNMAERVHASAMLLIHRATCRYEFRTTVHPSLHDPFDIDEMAEEIHGAAAYHLQQFHPVDSLDTSLLSVPLYGMDFFRAVADRVSDKFPVFSVRNLPDFHIKESRASDNEMESAPKFVGHSAE